MVALGMDLRELRIDELDTVSGAGTFPIGGGWYGAVDEAWGSANDWTTTGVGYDAGDWSVSVGSFDNVRFGGNGFQVSVTFVF